ncbi:ABC transporter ATP-binding protein [Pseudoalteromonas phenolica]|uniref:ABC transporter ATP-binding protein n=1 Tax=Pseudoalteromonas phenolica TaxID=161398 RepID=A0A0S2K279_9GAMM|nr:ABC transporter ATP-binding protein [Pseudoalteromonas phenolica]ALO42406.1 ABC transporter ATP-binding protein [Pseudoalteromonas phenolica]MBE0356497.1 putative ABC transport system ATP-binding protein [Pseudoalteromonas phenolica O-BC30]RXE94324.1 ABC transporter ATP-binding protein [Pseudoalteromonas phenolica O-BC30]TMO53994.1 ABC transporter ATP-binding protein [Pseudoalteromonas phenolica]
MSLLSLSNINKSFLTEDIETHALSNINLEIAQGEYVSLSGPSGCGKSTLLSILGLLDTATSGQYLFNGQDVTGFSRDKRAQIRCYDIGFVFQSFNLISSLTISENIMLPLTYQNGVSKSLMQSKVDEVLERVGMQHRANHYPSQLSGGQQQRVAVARALVNDPKIIFADEPTGNLDSQNAEKVMALFDQLHRDGSTICMVTHDPRSAQMAQRQVSILDGTLVNDVMLHSVEKVPA